MEPPTRHPIKSAMRNERCMPGHRMVHCRRPVGQEEDGNAVRKLQDDETCRLSFFACCIVHYCVLGLLHFVRFREAASACLLAWVTMTT